MSPITYDRFIIKIIILIKFPEKTAMQKNSTRYCLLPEICDKSSLMPHHVFFCSRHELCLIIAVSRQVFKIKVGFKVPKMTIQAVFIQLL